MRIFLDANTTAEKAFDSYKKATTKNSKDTQLSILFGDNVSNDVFNSVLKKILDDGAITALEITSANLDSTKLAAVKDILSNEKTLNSLNLSDNNLGDEGAKVLAGILGANAGIKDVNVNINNITDAGAATLGVFLQNDNQVNSLHVSGNSITNADLLLHNNLTNIYLDSNNITALDKTPSLPQGGWVDFSDNAIHFVSPNFTQYFEENQIKLDLRDTGLIGASTDYVLYGTE
jgi:Leucine Rich repeat